MPSVRRSWSWKALPRAGCIALLVLYIGPLLLLLASSFKTVGNLFDSTLGSFWPLTLEAYRSTIGSVLVPLRNSFVIAAGASTVTTMLASGATYALVRISGGRRRKVAFGVFGFLVLLQMVPQATTVTPIYTVLVQVHLINSLVGLVIVDSGLLLPFAVLILRPHFMNVPLELEEAATIDGAGTMAVFSRVVLPQVKNGLVVSWLLMFVMFWGEFIYAVTFLNTGSLFPLSVLILDQVGNNTTNWNTLLAAGVITALPIVVVLALTQRQFREGLSSGAFK